jgi:hypothetical protein
MVAPDKVNVALIVKFLHIILAIEELQAKVLLMVKSLPITNAGIEVKVSSSRLARFSAIPACAVSIIY